MPKAAKKPADATPTPPPPAKLTEQPVFDAQAEALALVGAITGWSAGKGYALATGNASLLDWDSTSEKDRMDCLAVSRDLMWGGEPECPPSFAVDFKVFCLFARGFVRS